MREAGEATSCPVRARPSTCRRLHFGLDPFGHRCCRAAPDSRAAAPQVCSCLSLAGDGRMRAGKRLGLAGGPESGSSYVADIEAAPGDVGPAAATR